MQGGDKKTYWFTGLFAPMPAEKFTTPATKLAQPEYDCYAYHNVPCTLALSMRHCNHCVLIRR